MRMIWWLRTYRGITALISAVAVVVALAAAVAGACTCPQDPVVRAWLEARS
jgi:hypothetical protein